MPGVNIKDDDRKRIDPKLMCSSCNLLLTRPMQTTCGHLICSSCVDTLLEGSRLICPEDGVAMKKEEIFPDTFNNRLLGDLPLHCPNTGCLWNGTYSQLDSHSDVCDHAWIKCTRSGCEMKLKRGNLPKHEKDKCKYRNVKCEYCQQDVSFASLKVHVSTVCMGVPVTCKFCKQEVLKKDIESHEQVVCGEVPAECEFHSLGCKPDKALKRSELPQHMHHSLTSHVTQLLHFTLGFETQLSSYVPRQELTGTVQKFNDDISEIHSGVAEKFDTELGKFTGMERRIESLETSRDGETRMGDKFRDLERKVSDIASELCAVRERNLILENKLKEKNLQLERMRSRMDQADESLALNTVKIADLESRGGPRAQQSIHSRNGTLLWKIENYERKRQDAINGVKTSLYSPPFYSAQYGYKMCAKIYMNGDGFGKGSHLSLFFVIMKGDYDALQSWPFQKKITMMLLDQGNGDHMIDAFHSDPQSSSFKCPNSEMNIASGSPLFMPIDSLSNRQYIKNDTLFIKIIVE
ncbi:TNF receptor-associated factor 3-like [Dendronephthya gigantea]|uniref:TNF receptor-associated factor 3-like n=1 Tax=Dendronephthya gigantea TaxID=151771 RepID=UPI00106BF5D7|nr:TNF receptor-associated factor 3-like [Dendronephthya gigantea]XP_028411640.1 TNF receptor-associated factor 3-like [Dendronephthya gigantea]